MGRRLPIYNLRHPAFPRDLQDRLGSEESRSVFSLYRMLTRALELRRWVPVLTLPKIPLEAYHMCLTASREVITIAQITLSFSFGGHYLTLLDPLIPYTDSPHRPHRRRNFRCRDLSSPDFQTDTPGGQWAKHPRRNQQGRIAVFYIHNYVPFIDRDHVRYGEGEAFRTCIRL